MIFYLFVLSSTRNETINRKENDDHDSVHSAFSFCNLRNRMFNQNPKKCLRPGEQRLKPEYPSSRVSRSDERGDARPYVLR